MAGDWRSDDGGMRGRVLSMLGMVLRRTMGAAGLAFILGAAVDLALAPLIVERLPSLTARWVPTGLAWLYLVPVLLGHGLEATLKPSMRTHGALALLTQPPNCAGRLAWTGPVALSVLALPVAAIWVHWGFALAWGLVLAMTIRHGLLPAAQAAALPNPVTAARAAGLRPLPGLMMWGAAVLGVGFILTNIVLGVVMLPLAKQGDPAFAPGSGLLPVLQVNLMLAIGTPGLAAVIAAAWQGHRQRAWQARH